MCTNSSQSAQNVEVQRGHAYASAARAARQPKHSPSPLFSTNMGTGNKWWCDRARCGADTKGKSHTGHSVGIAATRVSQRGHVYVVAAQTGGRSKDTAAAAHWGAGSFRSVGKPISTSGCRSENFAASFAVSGGGGMRSARMRSKWPRSSATCVEQRRVDGVGARRYRADTWGAWNLISTQGATLNVPPDRSASLRTTYGSAAR